MAGVVRAHHMGTRPGVAMLFNQIGKRLIDEGLKLATLFSCAARGRSRECQHRPASRIFPEASVNLLSFEHIMIDHETSRNGALLNQIRATHPRSKGRDLSRE